MAATEFRRRQSAPGLSLDDPPRIRPCRFRSVYLAIIAAFDAATRRDPSNAHEVAILKNVPLDSRCPDYVLPRHQVSVANSGGA